MKVRDYRRQVEAELERARAAGRLAGAAVPGPDNWSAALNLLRDRNAEIGARTAAFELLQAGAFDVSRFAPLAASFVTALQEIAMAEEAPADLRRVALDHLANEGDEIARRVLAALVEHSGSAVLPQAAALEMLARDDHGSAVPVARRLLEESDAPEVRAQAARILGSDPGSAGRLEQLMADSSEALEVRRAGAVALRALRPEAFQAAARTVLGAVDT